MTPEVIEIDNVQLLIEEIKKRPALYDNTLKEYSDKKVKSLKWKEVCEIVFRFWSSYSVEAKRNALAIAKRKWVNLKCCFKREIKSRQNTMLKRRRPFVHYQRMMFYLPYIDKNSSLGTLLLDQHLDVESEPSPEEPFCHPSYRIDSVPVDHEESLIAQDTANCPSSVFVKPLNFTDRNSKETQKTKHDLDMDEDRNFAVSLVPMLARLDQNNKLDAKIDILKIFRKYTPDGDNDIFYESLDSN